MNKHQQKIKQKTGANLDSINSLQQQIRPTEKESKDPIFNKTDISLKYLFGEFCFYIATFQGCHIQNDLSKEIKTSFEPIHWFKKMDLNKSCLRITNASAENLNTGIKLVPGGIHYIHSIVPLYYIKIKGTFEDYLQNNFKKKQRYNLKRTIKLFASSSEGGLDFRCYRNSDEINEFLTLAQKVSKLTYQHKMLKAGLPDTDEFRKHLLKLAIQKRFYGYLLLRNKKPIAFAYCTRKGRLLNYSIIGYDPIYANESPGNVLLMLILEHIFKETKIDIFDFGPGYAQYKSIFSTHHSMVTDIFIFRKTMKNYLCVVVHYCIDLCNLKAGHFLSKFGIKEHIRKFLREIK